jgi:spore coat polysaccharide biosynthesis protein SpsF
MKVVATIEARMTSSRLPGKVLMLANEKPMLWYLIERLKKVSGIHEVVLATTTNASDDALVRFAKDEGISYYRGSEENVMQRVIDAAASVNADVLVEITADCPIIDPEIISQCLSMYFSNECDYLGNALVRSYPDGMDTQIFKLNTLKDSAAKTNAPLHLEHVSLHLREHPELYKHINVVAPPKLFWPELGLTLDEKEDYELLKRVIEYFSPDIYFSCDSVVELLRANPSWISNKDVKRKGNS